MNFAPNKHYLSIRLLLVHTTWKIWFYFQIILLDFFFLKTENPLIYCSAMKNRYIFFLHFFFSRKEKYYAIISIPYTPNIIGFRFSLFYRNNKLFLYGSKLRFWHWTTFNDQLKHLITSFSIFFSIFCCEFSFCLCLGRRTNIISPTFTVI